MSANTKTKVLITGCSDGGMGAALAAAFHRAGLHVYATARNPGKMTHLGSLGIETLELDVQSQASIDSCINRLSGLDRLVNNAGSQFLMPIVDTDIKKAKDLFDLNVWSHIAVTQAFLPLLLESPKALIVNQTSVGAVTTLPFQAVYNASKAALAMFSDSLRLELEAFGIKVVDLRTGVVKTNLIKNVQGPSATLPKGSIYEPAKEAVEKALRQDGFEGQGMPAEEWARLTVQDLLKKNPPAVIWRGESAWLTRLAAILPFDDQSDSYIYLAKWIMNHDIDGDAIQRRRLRNREAQRRFREKRRTQNPPNHENLPAEPNAPTFPHGPRAEKATLYGFIPELPIEYDGEWPEDLDLQNADDITVDSDAIEQHMICPTPAIVDEAPSATSSKRPDATEEDVTANNQPTNWLSPIRMAAQKGNDRIVRMLAQRGIDCNVKDSHGLTPIMYAVIGGHEDVVRSLISQHAHISPTNCNGRRKPSALHLAVSHRHETILGMLLDYCSQDSELIDCYDDQWRAPLHLAIHLDFEAGVLALLQHGADPRRKTLG
ncbi:short-chain dehydrogenase [Seiridium cupressi]